MRKIAVINQKGGSGKTTTVVNTGWYLSESKRKVLIIDLDPQAHSTIHLGLEPPEVEKSIYEVLTNEISFEEAIFQVKENLFLVPSKIELASAEIELVTAVGREKILKEAIKKYQKNFDYILIDCPPSLGLLTLNALTTGNEVFIPIQAEFFALEGLTKLLQTIQLVKKRLNSSLEISGIIITMFDKRKNICKDVAKKVKEHFKNKVFKTMIRENVRLAEAPGFGKSIYQFSPDSHGAEDYKNLTKEIIKQENKK